MRILKRLLVFLLRNTKFRKLNQSSNSLSYSEKQNFKIVPKRQSGFLQRNAKF